MTMSPPNVMYLTLAIYPAIVMLTPEPARFLWWIRTGGLPMPPGVWKKSRRNEPMVLTAKFLLLIAATSRVATHSNISLHDLGFHLSPKLVVAAVVGASILILWMARMQKLAQRFKHDPRDYRPVLLEAPTWQILVVIVVGGFAEEFWRAASLIIGVTAVSTTKAVLLTSMIFGLGHLQSPQAWPKALGRVLGPAVAGVFLAVLFLTTASLFVPFFVHIASNSLSALMGRTKLTLQQPKDEPGSPPDTSKGDQLRRMKV